MATLEDPLATTDINSASVGPASMAFAAPPATLTASAQALINNLSPGFGDAVAAALPVASISGAVTPGHLPSGPFGTIYAFGDSLSDNGNVYIASANQAPPSPPYAHDFSNGPVWVQDLAQSLNIPFTPSLAGGTDYAIGGAESGATVAHPASAIDIPAQIDSYRTTVPTPSHNAVATMWIGANDVTDAIGLIPTNPILALTSVNQAVINETNYIRQLAATGIQNFVVVDVPDLGKTPDAIAKGASGVDAATAFSAVYDTELSGAIHQLSQQQPNLNIDFVDTYGLIDNAVANPSAYGLANVTAPAYSGTFTPGSTGTVVSNPGQYLFWDTLHPTQTTHSIIAAVVQQTLAPVA